MIPPFCVPWWEENGYTPTDVLYLLQKLLNKLIHLRKIIRVVRRERTDEQDGAVVSNDTCASSMPTCTISRTIGKATYVANLNFKEQGQTFLQKLKRVLRADCP